MDAKKVVGDNVRRYREASGLTQAGLADLMGVDRAYISGLELGQRNPTVVTLWHTANALRVKPHQLLEEKERLETPARKAPVRRKARKKA